MTARPARRPSPFSSTARNDAAALSGTFTGTVKEDTDVSGSTLTATGTIATSDVDTGQAHTTVQTNTPGQYGTFSIDAAGAWTYVASNGQVAIQQLALGQTLTETFTVTSQDGTASQPGHDHGAGHQRSAGAYGGQLASYTDTAATDLFATTTGQIAIGAGAVGTLSDVDQTGSYTFARAGTAMEDATNDAYGMLTVNPDGSYSFAPNAAAINALTQSTTLTYTILVDDGSGVANATNTASFTLTLNGVQDTPTTGGATTPSVTEDLNVLTGTDGSHTIQTSGVLTVADAGRRRVGLSSTDGDRNLWHLHLAGEWRLHLCRGQ